jgi:hypothetical protein
MPATVKRTIRRRLRSLFEKVEQIIEQVAVHKTRPLRAGDVFADAWLLDEQGADVLIEPEFWRTPTVSRRVH